MTRRASGLLRGVVGLALLFGAGLTGSARAQGGCSVFDRCSNGVQGCVSKIRGYWADDCCCADECCEGECCEDGCCDSGCCDGDWCCLGDPWTLQDLVYGDYCGCPPFQIGGWTQIGWHDGRGRRGTGTGMFNSHPDHVRLHQQYFYAERVANSDACCGGVDWGFRADAVFGADAPDTQAFGGEFSHWDADNDFGAGHGWAFPQLYGEIASGDTSVKVGKFYTLVGYEVVTAPDNFFYSHAYTMYNSEPFTHTGVLATQHVNDCLTVYGGWVDGWDTGYEFTGGSQFIGGASVAVNCDVTVTYVFLAGDREVGGGGQGNLSRDGGYNHSVVVDVALSDNLNYIVQSDFVDYNNTSPTGTAAGTGQHQYGVNQYLIYWYNDCLGFGSRFEWWHTNEDRFLNRSGGSSDVYSLTYGLNVRPHANVIVRPEVRWDWNQDGVVNGLNDVATLGVDAIFTF